VGSGGLEGLEAEDSEAEDSEDSEAVDSEVEDSADSADSVVDEEAVDVPSQKFASMFPFIIPEGLPDTVIEPPDRSRHRTSEP